MRLEVDTNQFMREQSIHVGRLAEKMSAETEKRVIREYKTAMLDLKSQMAKVYEKYENAGGVLSYNDMTKYNRMDAMFRDMEGTLKKMINTTNLDIKNNSVGVFTEAYYRHGYIMEHGAEAALSFGVLNPKVIQAAANNPISGLTLSETLKSSRPIVITRIRSTVTQGLLKGESYTKMTKRLQSTLEDDVVKTNRIVRTEGHRAAMQGQLAAQEHAAKRGVEFLKEWISTLDDRTRDTHQGLDGVRIKQEENFVTSAGNKGPAPGMFGAPSEDINCRCDLGSVLPGAGKTVVRQTYQEWAKERKIPVKRVEPLPVVAKTTKTLAETLAEIKKNAIGRDLTLDDIDKAGDAVLEDIKSVRAKLQAEYDDFLVRNPGGYEAVDKQKDEVLAKMNETTRIYNSKLSVPGTPPEEYARLRAEIDEYTKQTNDLSKKSYDLYLESKKYTDLLNKFPNPAKAQEAFTEYLSKIRKVGPSDVNALSAGLTGNKNATAMIKSVKQACNGYPTEWVDASTARGMMEVSKVQRGYYNNWSKKIAISPGYDNGLSTSVHEMGHRFEYTVGNIKSLEKEFYQKRTAGESLEWLGAPYAKSEKTRKDLFIDAYMGKDYGGQAYELVSMGFEYAYTRPAMLLSDPEYARFIYGILAVV